MKYLKFTPYIYAFIALYFIYEGITKLSSGDENYWLSFVIAVAAIFMFFFRRKYAKKFEDRNRNQ